MKKNIHFLLFLFFFISAKSASAPWGFWAHQKINEMAVYTLPQELFAFYKPHVDYIAEHAVDPDKRRYAVVDEAPKHYLDLNHYGKYPYEMIPRNWFDAVDALTEDTLQAYGIVPWHIERMMNWLTVAMQENDAKGILRLSAEIGHYIADAHVPLHTNENYNGQLTNQHGIHGFWESRIPELLGNDYDYFVGKATYIENVNEEIWDIILKSNLMSDSVLNFEAALNASFPSDKKYSYEQRGQSTVRTYSQEYTLAYNALLNNQVERRMRETIINLGSFWYTAWVNAGKPNLTNIAFIPFTEDELKQMQELENTYNANSKMKGRSEE